TPGFAAIAGRQRRQRSSRLVIGEYRIHRPSFREEEGKGTPAGSGTLRDGGSRGEVRFRGGRDFFLPRGEVPFQGLAQAAETELGQQPVEFARGRGQVEVVPPGPPARRQAWLPHVQFPGMDVKQERLPQAVDPAEPVGGPTHRVQPEVAAPGYRQVHLPYPI